MDKSVSIADVVFDRIEEDILNGTFARGDIISELKLSAMLGVSRTPIREALTRLRQEGLVEESGKGSKVIGITKKDISDIYDVRIRLEGLASAICAKTVTGEQLSRLAETLDLQEYYTEKGASDRIKNLDSEFHHLIYSYADSRIIENLLTDLHRKVQRFRRVSVESADRARAAVAEHREILGALRAHDADLAERLTVKHVENAKKSILISQAVKNL
ncbi:MAG: GntR family transcriptional regulator [Clostridia bacterium]|nr:GntR family transcriptional regulator [Clostridia bacterium]